VFNFIFSIIVFAGVFLYVGQATEKPLIGELKPNPGNEELFETGDLVLSVDGEEIEDLAEFYTFGRSLPPAESASYTVERGDETLSFDSIFPFPPILDSLQVKSAAIDAGLEVGDVVLSVDGTSVWSLTQVSELVQAGEGRAMALSVWRNGDIVEVTLTPRKRDIPTEEGFETRWLIGFTGGAFFEPQTVPRPFLDSVAGGARATWETLTSSLSGLWHIVSGRISTCNMSGAIGIAQASGHMASQGPVDFILLIASLSAMIGMINLFPIPILDGGHLVFHAYEAVFRRPPNDRVLGALMTGGLFILLSVMIFALSRDIVCI
jgi:regulator of sigma E protease